MNDDAGLDIGSFSRHRGEGSKNVNLNHRHDAGQVYWLLPGRRHLPLPVNSTM
ncbi:hypothetical protein E4U27_003517 [Claviceps purpurea]|nr:hypothetical protein E4U27_003517 [Claviceps purpurea]